MATATVSGTTVGTYTYDMQNRRTKKLAASTSYYVYGLNGLLYGEYNSSGALIREYIYLNGQPLAQVDTGSPEFVTYLHTDHLGTPRFGTNSSGTQVWAMVNDAFGTSTPTGTGTVNLRMAGQYYDSESGLFYNINRSYSPAIGRYISSDPIGLAGGPYTNTYGYGKANPVGNADPLGLYIGQRFSNPDEAACDALKNTNPVSIAQNVEYGGVIKYDSSVGKYFATDPVTSGSPLYVIIPDAFYTDNSVGDYHTHAAPNDDPEVETVDEDFSPADRAKFYSLQHRFGAGFTSYLATPSGKYLKKNYLGEGSVNCGCSQ